MVVGGFSCTTKILCIRRYSEHMDGVEEEGPDTYVRLSIFDEGGKK
jgi:hypothetical protein